MTAIGIDIGTTTICFSVYDLDKQLVCAQTIPNNASKQVARGPVQQNKGIQDAQQIYNDVQNKLDSILDDINDEVACIGIAGQMHGIVYLDKEAQCISPLYTWQFNGGAEEIHAQTGCRVPSGWGFATIYYHILNAELPSKAATFCTIQDYVAMRLSKMDKPLIHISNAASFGLFDIEKGQFMHDKIALLGMGQLNLPDISDGYDILGKYREIPVCIAIGDNQASFIASVRDMEHGALLNIGTGSQITYTTQSHISPAPGIEIRPCFKGTNIAVGASLCGGRAIAMLETFYRKTAELVMGVPVESAYPGMDRCLSQCIENAQCFEHAQYIEQADLGSGDDSLLVSTKFCGTREDESERGYISNISVDNLTPENMLVGFMRGVIGELYDLYSQCGAVHTRLYGAGNALRKNKFLQYTASARFRMPLQITENSEETAFGAILYALVCTKLCKSVEEAQKLIKYHE